MEALLDAADALVQEAARTSKNRPSRPDLSVPEEYEASSDLLLEMRTTSSHGRGWYAKRDIAAGTVLMTAKPVAMVMNWQEEGTETNASGRPALGPAPVADASARSLEKMQSDEYPDDMDEDGDDEEQEEDDRDPLLNELLLLKVLHEIVDQPNLWTNQLSQLFPRTSQELAKLPAWVCADDNVFMEIENWMAKLQAVPSLQSEARSIAQRLPLIIRYNILSIETCPELLSHPSEIGHATLSGVGLYHEPSFFNHSARPNCNRWAVGDVMVFVTNQGVHAGTHLCISYIEHDVLCESAYRRNLMLSMDFMDSNDEDGTAAADNGVVAPTVAERQGPDMPVVDTDVQNELMSMNALERLSALDELLQQATGLKGPQDEDEDDEISHEELQSSMNEIIMMEDTDGHGPLGSKSLWFQCDIQNLRIIQAITFEALSQSAKALPLWEVACTFCDKHMPPHDENAIVTHTQAALCAWHMHMMGKSDDTTVESRAHEHAQRALRTHHILFGGGVARFRRRMKADLKLPLRPGQDKNVMNILWPLQGP